MKDNRSWKVEIEGKLHDWRETPWLKGNSWILDDLLITIKTLSSDLLTTALSPVYKYKYTRTQSSGRVKDGAGIWDAGGEDLIWWWHLRLVRLLVIPSNIYQGHIFLNRTNWISIYICVVHISMWDVWGHSASRKTQQHITTAMVYKVLVVKVQVLLFLCVCISEWVWAPVPSCLHWVALSGSMLHALQTKLVTIPNTAYGGFFFLIEKNISLIFKFVQEFTPWVHVFIVVLQYVNSCD